MPLLRPALLGLFLLLLTATSWAADHSQVIAGIVAGCPAAARIDVPRATDAQVQSACACVGPYMEAAINRLGAVTPTNPQLKAIGEEAGRSCLGPLIVTVRIAHCISDADFRSGIKALASINDAQFDRYCGCSVRLTVAELLAGLDMDDPKSAKAMNDKTRTQCLEPIRAGTYRE